MKFSSKRFLSILMIMSMVIASSGCNLNPEHGVYDAAESFAKAVASMDDSGIIKLSSSKLKDSNKDTLSELCDYDSILEDYAVSLIDTEVSSISYVIDAGSVSALPFANKGSVDVTFTMLDWNSAINDEETLTVDDLEDASTFDVKVSLSLVKENGKWLVSNTSSVINKLYDFVDDLNIIPGPTTEYVSNGFTGTWWFTDDGVVPAGNNNTVYTDVFQIDLDLNISGTDIDSSTIYYTVIHDGDLVYTSPAGNHYGYFGSSQGATLTPSYDIVPGTYIISFYDGNDELLLSDFCTVNTSYVDD